MKAGSHSSCSKKADQYQPFLLPNYSSNTFEKSFFIFYVEIIATFFHVGTALENKSRDKEDQAAYDKDLSANEKSIKNAQIRKRIDDLLEQKKLKELLDDSEDWDV